MKNKYIRKIEKDEHVYNSLNMNLYMDFNNVKDVCMEKNPHVKDVLIDSGIKEYINLIKHIIMCENDIGIIISKGVPHMLLYNFLTLFFRGITDAIPFPDPNKDYKKIDIIGGRHLYITADENDKILPRIFTKIYISNQKLEPSTWETGAYSIFFLTLFTGNTDIFFSKAIKDYITMQHASDIFALIVKNSS